MILMIKNGCPDSSFQRRVYRLVADFEIRYYRENINTTGDARQCELRVAIITDRDQESAFPLPDYAQEVYNK